MHQLGSDAAGYLDEWLARPALPAISEAGA